MCHFLSFCVNTSVLDGAPLKVYVGYPFAHTGISSGWSLLPEEYTEVEWLADGTLDARRSRAYESSALKAAILAEFSTRTDLIKRLKWGRAERVIYLFKTGKTRRLGTPKLMVTSVALAFKKRPFVPGALLAGKIQNRVSFYERVSSYSSGGMELCGWQHFRGCSGDWYHDYWFTMYEQYSGGLYTVPKRDLPVPSGNWRKPLFDINRALRNGEVLPLSC